MGKNQLCKSIMLTAQRLTCRFLFGFAPLLLLLGLLLRAFGICQGLFSSQLDSALNEAHVGDAASVHLKLLQLATAAGCSLD